MALTYRKPGSPQSDLNLNMFFSASAPEETALYRKRTLPAEWANQSGVQLTWPHADTDWAYILEEVTTCYMRLAYEIALRETLLIVAPRPEEVKALLEERLPKRVTDCILYKECPTNDTWARDHAFLTVLSPDGAELTDFRFNGWGGKFEATLDNAINRRLAPALNGKYVDYTDFELEGGSIETDGRGTLLTTSECLLNPNRNPRLNKEQIEDLLRERLGVTRFLWLDHGYLAGDDTDSHIDTLARLCPDDTIVYVKCDDKQDEHYDALRRMEEQLQTFLTETDAPYRLLPLPMAAPVYDENGERLPATYANFLIMNTAVLYPTYADPERDEAAAKVLAAAFPGRDIVGVDCRPLIKQHGSLHCVTMQYPYGVLPKE